MPLKAVVFQQDPFNYEFKEYSCYDSFVLEDHEMKPNAENLCINNNNNNGYNWDSPPCSAVAQNTTTSSTEICRGGALAPIAAASRRKRRRTKSSKNVEEMENQRMTHIAVERNRRRQMNDYLAVLRSLMPPSYAQRGDQASIVGGAINFVKELEQLLQFLEANKPANQQTPNAIFSNFFTFPQYSTSPSTAVDTAAERRSGIADIEVTMAESHANIKILSERRPKQLLRMVSGFQSMGLTILHLNITTVDQSVLYSFSVKVEDECQLTTVNEIATAVHDMLGMIQEESTST
ncbi:hypothetical protein BUALT_Bualt04G0027600 [Buddleja alternifolia]|uniref:BHLH domain-containing protein n=1 Tax=Buddleja alternifolia TaxID=168488 RepID=A0AAV6XWN7_9LAMI|nr:hypothetical protein BUALT_Bualt04G0027600 [Buddleja alternifolia]